MFDLIFPPEGNFDWRRGGGEQIATSHFKTCLFYICLPRKGTLTDAGDGDGGGASFFKNMFKNNMFLNIFYTILFILYIFVLCISYILYSLDILYILYILAGIIYLIYNCMYLYFVLHLTPLAGRYRTARCVPDLWTRAGNDVRRRPHGAWRVGRTHARWCYATLQISSG